MAGITGDIPFNPGTETPPVDGEYIVILQDNTGWKYYEVKELFMGLWVFDGDGDDEDNLSDVIGWYPLGKLNTTRYPVK
jgi:hypothetical protein